MTLVVGLGLGCASFLGLAILILLNRPLGAMGWRLLTLCLLTASWAALGADAWWMPGVTHLFENARTFAWLDLLLVALAGPADERRNLRVMRIAVAVTVAAATALDARFVFDTASPIDFHLEQAYSRVIIATIGILLVENVYRNGAPGRRWNIMPLCLAAAALFGLDFYTFASSIVRHSVDSALLAARGIVLIPIAPLLLLTMARNSDWQIYVHVSRNVVFHTATLILGGLFFLFTAGLASFFGYIGGPWGGVFQISVVLLAIIGFVVTLSVARLRSSLWRFINENFFSSRYDYRVEWTRFVETISSSDDRSPLRERVVNALSNIIDTPGGALWLEDFDGTYRPVTVLRTSIAPGAAELSSGPLLTAFRDQGRALEFTLPHARRGQLSQPPWTPQGYPVWLAVPLFQKRSVVGFITLPEPRASQALNWETFDLLRTLGHQIASYLVEERATAALADAKSIIEYSKNLSFITHDIKNIAGQLTMLVSNSERFGDNPEFRADMLLTLRNAVGKLNRLLEAPVPRDRWDVIDPRPVIQSAAEAICTLGRSVALDMTDAPLRVNIAAADLDSVVSNLLTNAVEASAPSDPIIVRLRAVGETVLIAVEDTGSGMDATFVRDVLFAPRQSTKPKGHGMGAFQTREIIRAAGGNLNVMSKLGIGTVIEVLLPAVSESQLPT